MKTDQELADLFPSKADVRIQVKCGCGCGASVLRPPANPKEMTRAAGQYAKWLISADTQEHIAALFSPDFKPKTKRERRIVALLATAVPDNRTESEAA